MNYISNHMNTLKLYLSWNIHDSSNSEVSLRSRLWVCVGNSQNRYPHFKLSVNFHVGAILESVSTIRSVHFRPLSWITSQIIVSEELCTSKFCNSDISVLHRGCQSILKGKNNKNKKGCTEQMK